MGEGVDEEFIPPWERDAVEPAREVSDAGGVDFFISYTNDDLEVTRWIAEQLRGQGSTVRFQQQDFAPGGEFPEDIDEAIEQARRVIAVVSAASLESEWCRREWHTAGDKLLPVRIEGVEVKGVLGVRTYVDLFGPGTNDEASRLAILLEAIAGTQPSRSRSELGSGIDLPQRRPALVGREPLLKQIYQHLHRKGDLGTPRVTLAGMGGTGKTAIASEYGHRMREHGEYARVWFVRAEQPAAFEDQLRALVSEVRMPRREVALATQVQQVLARQRAWLLIIDQASDLGAVADYLPASGDGHVLITSENTSTWGRANSIEVPGWLHDEAVDFILKQTGAADRADADALVTELDCHPEMLLQAASFIDDTGVSISDYLTRYRTQQSQAAESRAASLALSIDQLASKVFAVETLRVAAFLAPDRIPVELLVSALNSSRRQIDERAFDLEVAQPLRRFSLIQRDGPHLVISRLVQHQVRASLGERGDSGRWIEMSLRALDDLFPQTDELAHPDVWPRAAELLPHLLAATEHARTPPVEPALVGRLWCRAGAYLGIAEFGEDPSAARVGPGSPGRTQPTRSASGVRDPAVMAMALLEDARRVLEEVHGHDHLDVAEAAASMGELLRIRNQSDRAIAYLADAYEIVSRVAGPDSPAAGLRLVQLARARRDAGRSSAAVEELERAAASAEGLGDAGRRLRYEALASLGIARTLQGRFEDAVAHLQESVQLQVDIWGADHVEVALTLDALGEALAGYGDAVAARATFDRKLEIERVIYRERGRFRDQGLVVAASHAISSRDLVRARELAAELRELVGDEPIPDDPTLSIAGQLMAQADRLQGGSEWRELLVLAGHDLVRAGLPNVEPRLLMADYCIDDGTPATGAELALIVSAESRAAGQWNNAANASFTEAAAWSDAGQLARATDVLLELVEFLAQHPEVEESLPILARLRLGDAYIALNHPADALASYEEASGLAVELGYVLHQADALLGQSAALTRRGMLAAAEAACRQAFALRTSVLRPGHELVSGAQIEVARALIARGGIPEARRHLEDVVAAASARSGSQPNEAAWTYVDVAEVLGALGLRAESVRLLDQALTLLQREGQYPSHMLQAKAAVGAVLLDLGERGRARELATSVRAAATAPSSRVAWVSSVELGLRIAAREVDFRGARVLIDELESELGTNAGLVPRRRALCWLLLSEIAETEGLAEAIDAAERALALDADPLYFTKDELELRVAYLRYRASDERAGPLLDELLARAREPAFRLQVLELATEAAFDARDDDRAAKLVAEVQTLANEDDDATRRAQQRIWIARQLRRVPEQDGATLRQLRLAADDLRAAGVAGPEQARTAAELQTELVQDFGWLDEYGEAASAFETAFELFGQIVDARMAQEDPSGSPESQLPDLLRRASEQFGARWTYPEPTGPSDRLNDAWPEQFVITLLDLLQRVLDYANGLDVVIRLVDRLGEHRLDPTQKISVLTTFARLRAARVGWDEPALAFLQAARQGFESNDGAQEPLLAELALLQADEQLYSGNTDAALDTLQTAADSLREATDVEARIRVLRTLGTLHLERGNAADAAVRFREAKTLLDELNGALDERLDLGIALAGAYLSAGDRAAGIDELRRAALIVKAKEPPVSVDTVLAMARLASALLDKAVDRWRADQVVQRTWTLNESLLRLPEPRSEALPELAELVRQLRGVDAALAMLGPVLQAQPDLAGGTNALAALVQDPDVTPQRALDAIANSDDPVARAQTVRMVATVFDLVGRPEDARVLLRTVIEQLESADDPSPALLVELLVELSGLDESEDRQEARTALGRALVVARDHVETADRVGEIEELLELELASADAWQGAIDRAASSRTEAERDIDWFGQAVAENPDPWSLYELAGAELRAGLYQAALDSAGQGLALSAEPRLLSLCANICNQIAEYEAAVEYARAALALDPGAADAQASLACALQHVSSSRGAECEAAFDQLVALSDADRMSRLYALRGRAGARRALGREVEATADYESVLAELGPEDDRWLAGWVHYSLGHYEDAAIAYEQALADDPSQLGARFDLGLAHAVAGNKEALDAYRAAIVLVDEREPRGRLAPLRVALDDLKDAVRVRPELMSVAAFQQIVAEVEERLTHRDSPLGELFLPKIPDRSSES